MHTETRLAPASVWYKRMNPTQTIHNIRMNTEEAVNEVSYWLDSDSDTVGVWGELTDKMAVDLVSKFIGLPCILGNTGVDASVLLGVKMSTSRQP